jgi:hypothetical protein
MRTRLSVESLEGRANPGPMLGTAPLAPAVVEPSVSPQPAPEDVLAAPEPLVGLDDVLDEPAPLVPLLALPGLPDDVTALFVPEPLAPPAEAAEVPPLVPDTPFAGGVRD